jgi:hypothetical protein
MRGALAWYDNSRCIAIRKHTTPKLRRRFGPERLDHPQLRSSQGLADVGAARQGVVELAHQRRAEGIVRSPKIRDDGPRSRGDERPDQTRHAVLALRGSPSKFFNQYEALTLGVYRREVPLVIVAGSGLTRASSV